MNRQQRNAAQRKAKRGTPTAMGIPVPATGDHRVLEATIAQHILKTASANLARRGLASSGAGAKP